MDRGIKKLIADSIGVSPSFISMFLNGNRKGCSLKIAKKLTKIFPNTNEVFWMSSSSDERISVLEASSISKIRSQLQSVGDAL